MQHTFKTILFTFLATTALASCSAIKNTFWNNDTAEDTVEYSDNGFETRLTPVENATDNELLIDIEEIECDSCLFEVPESMNANTDSLLNSWQARTLLRKLDCNTSGWESIVMTDTMYAKRLASMPTIVKMPYNNMVRTCIDRYAKKMRSQVSYMLGISEFYMPIIEEEIDRLGVPHELRYLPVIESAMNPKAKSRMGAKGLWQFMFTTGKLYGLRSNNYIDERFDPIKSTKAALRYLKDLYEMFGNWELAIAAYNCGPGNVNKAIRRSGGKTDFWKIYPWLPRETRR